MKNSCSCMRACLCVCVCVCACVRLQLGFCIRVRFALHAFARVCPLLVEQNACTHQEGVGSTFVPQALPKSGADDELHAAPRPQRLVCIGHCLGAKAEWREAGGGRGEGEGEEVM